MQCACDFMLLCAILYVEIRKSFYILQRSVNATASPLTSSWSPVCPCLACVYSQSLVCTYRARWALSWVCECGLLCLLHLGLHMAQQTTAGERGGRAGGRALPPPLQGCLYDSRVLQQGTGTNAKWKGHMSPLQPQDHYKARCHLYRVNLTVFESNNQAFDLLHVLRYRKSIFMILWSDVLTFEITDMFLYLVLIKRVTQVICGKTGFVLSNVWNGNYDLWWKKKKKMPKYFISL